jgi:hypothetical protein
MPEITRDHAVQRLVPEIASMRPNDLVEVYNELFPTEPTTGEQARQNRSRVLGRINDHIAKGLYPEEIVSLWNVTFPKDRYASYDEESDKIRYGEPVEYVYDTD